MSTSAGPPGEPKSPAGAQAVGVAWSPGWREIGEWGGGGIGRATRIGLPAVEDPASF